MLILSIGKTILASMVIEEARKHQAVSVIYFYCRYRDCDRSTFLGVARGLLSQLLSQDDALLDFIHDKASKSGQATLSTESIAIDLLGTSIKNCDKLYVVIDGLDECERDERKKIVAFFENTWNSLPQIEQDSLRCLFLSQDDGAARKDFASMSFIKITQDHTKRDIQAYTLARSLEIQAKLSLSPDLQQNVQRLVADKAEGKLVD
jgi:hypothetical protein